MLQAAPAISITELYQLAAAHPGCSMPCLRLEGICSNISPCHMMPYSFHLKCSYCDTMHESILAAGPLPACCQANKPPEPSQFEEIVEGRVECQVCLPGGLLLALLTYANQICVALVLMMGHRSMVQAQLIELQAVPSFKHPSGAEQQDYPHIIKISLQGPTCGTVQLGDHLQLTGFCRSSGIRPAQGLARLTFAEICVSCFPSVPCSICESGLASWAACRKMGGLDISKTVFVALLLQISLNSCSLLQARGPYLPQCHTRQDQAV